MNPSPSIPASHPGGRNPLQAEWPLPLVIALGVAWACLFYFRDPVPPFEDAAMLLRYAEHLAAGHGIVWNVGEAPVDGATDFGFMVLCAGLVRLGLSGMWAALLLTVVSHALTVVLVYRIHRRQADGKRWAAALSALVVATGPAFNYIEAGFGTTVFALAGLCAWDVFQRMVVQGYRRGMGWRFAIAGLLTGLIRPEGVILVLGMLAALMWVLPASDRKAVLRAFALAFVLPGAVYFAWHWAYFGHPLPNPFYVKGGGHLHWASLRAACTGIVIMAGPLLGVFAQGLVRSRDPRRTWALLLPVGLFLCAWILMSNAMNFSFRFQYVLMPICWVAWWPVAKAARAWEWRPRDVRDGAPALLSPQLWAGIAIVLGLGMVAFQAGYHALPSRIHRDGRAELGEALRRVAGPGHTMAVTEAGNLPYYSGWRAIDLWGLNDVEIAHAGVVTTARLAREAPALVMVHDYWSPGVAKQRPEPRWAQMTDSIEAFVREGYTLVGCWGRERGSAHFYYLRDDHPSFGMLERIIADFPAYYWYEDGELAENFLRKEE